MREELGVAESGLETVIREPFALLDLIQFFTAGQDAEAEGDRDPRGRLPVAPRARSHSDMERGFAAAEVTPWDALVEAGGYAQARERPSPAAGWRGAGTPGAGRGCGDLSVHALGALALPAGVGSSWPKSSGHCYWEL